MVYWINRLAAGCMMARKLELRRLRWIANDCGLLTEELLDELGDYMHKCKSSGDKGTKNDRGDFTDDEIRERLAELKDLLGLNG